MQRFWSTRLALVIVAIATLVVGAALAVERSSSAMATAANRFVDSLSTQQRQQALFRFDGDERLRWHFIPPSMFERHGLPIKAMSDEQRRRARDLVKAGLSQHGYLTTTAIMDLETTLGDLERKTGGTIPRDPELYFFSIFGTPSTSNAWGWRLDGHHVSLNFTVVKGTLVASSPSFFGANPAEIRDGPQKGLRILGAEEDAARRLVQSLDQSQRAIATINGVAPPDIATTNAERVDPLSPVGIVGTALGSNQRDLLMRLIEVYTGFMARDLAADRMAKLQRAGVEKIAFAWAGGLERGKKHYYRVQGPTFLIEYDNTQDDANHIHSVWRDFDGDFGRDLLREHVKSTPHP